LCITALFAINIGMIQRIVHSNFGVTLLGGGEVDPGCVAESLTIAPCLVAADGGADRALAFGLSPQAVIGDFDSISAEARAMIAPERLHPIAEQQSTDFDKCLMHVQAPFFLALGFAGGRLDHTLAAMSVLVRHPGRRVLLVGRDDVVFVAPPELDLNLRPGTRFSLYPMGQVTGVAQGLRWSLEGAPFTPDGRIGTSNEALGPVRLSLSGPMLVLLPRDCLMPALAGLGVPSAALGE
jgi:thiamine pyrophosphokinase